MIEDFIYGNMEELRFELLIIAGVWVLVMLSVMIDLYFGVQKARMLNELRTSQGYVRTVRKISFYYAMLTFALFFDLIDLFTPLILPFPLSIAPIGTIIAGVVLILIEGKSVFEKGEDKDRRKIKANLNLLVELLRSKDNLPEDIVEILKTTKLSEKSNKTLKDDY